MLLFRASVADLNRHKKDPMNVEEYLRLSNMTRNSELELITLYNKKQRILEAQSHRAKQAVLELDRVVLVLRQEVSDLRARMGEQEAVHSDTRERNDALRRENDELREMLRESQKRVQRDHTELEKEIGVLRRENARLEEQATRLQQERDEAERRSKDLSVENARVVQQNTCLRAENSALSHENERLNRDLHLKDAKSAQDMEDAKSELVRRNKELECSNKELGASLLNMQLQYNDLLVKNAEILKNASLGESMEKRVAAEAGGKWGSGAESSAGDSRTVVQREDVAAILRELLQNGASGAGALTEKTSGQLPSSKDPEASGAGALTEKTSGQLPSSKDPEARVVSNGRPKSTTREKGTESKPASSGIARRGPGRPPGKRSAPQPEKLSQKALPASAALCSSSSEEKSSGREAAECADKHALSSVAPGAQTESARSMSADTTHKTLNEKPPVKKVRAGMPAYGSLAKRRGAVGRLGGLAAKSTEDAARDSGVPAKEITKIDNESFFANLTFSSSSPFFKK